MRAEARRGGLDSAHDVLAYLLLGPDELESFTAGAPRNTDDNARIEFAAPRDLLGYAKFDPYLAKVYGPLWPYGRLTGVVTGYDGPDRGPARRAAGAQPAGARQGARVGAVDAPRRGGRRLARGAARAPAAAAWSRPAWIATPRSRSRPARGWRRPSCPPRSPPRIRSTSTLVAEQYPDVLAERRGRRYATAYKILEKWPEAMWTGLGQDFSLLSGFLDYKAELYGDAVDELKHLAEDATYAARRPEVLYYLGRAYYANAIYTKAVEALERYVRSQTVLDRPLLPVPTGSAMR